MHKQALLRRLNWPDAFADFTPLPAPESWSWHFDRPFFEALYRQLPQPQLVVEVGSWLGHSAMQAVTFYAHQLSWRNFTLICVDTWLGSAEHWLEPEPGGRRFPRTAAGYPDVYTHFLSNLAHAGLDELILPLPQTSRTAARILAHHLQAGRLPACDWIFLDASHDRVDVLLDCAAWWPLLRPGGWLFGDDWQWPTVAEAVRDFAGMQGGEILTSAYSWALRKP